MAPMRLNRLNLSKPVIAAVSGPAVAGGMEFAFWAAIRVMEKVLTSAFTAVVGVFL